MAYDLILRRQTGRNHACGEGMPPPSPAPIDRQAVGTIALVGLGLAGAVAWSLPKARRSRERRYYQRTFRDDLHATQEIPIVSMSEMVFQQDRETP
jgi:hypothetical protein